MDKEKTVNIKNFIGVYDNYITENQCDQAIKLFESEKAGCAVMFDQNLRHEAISGNKNYRYVLLDLSINCYC